MSGIQRTDGPQPQYCNLKGIVKDLVKRQAPYGSFKESVRALTTNDTSINRNGCTTDGFARAKWIFYGDNPRSVKNVCSYVAVADNTQYESDGSYLTDFTTLTGGITYKTKPGENKFYTMGGYDKQSGCNFTIFDSGKDSPNMVGPDDTIVITPTLPDGKPDTSKEPTTMTIKEFLGDNY